MSVIQLHATEQETFKIFEDLKGLIEAYDFKTLSEIAGVHPSTLYNWSGGVTKSPQIRTLTHVANAVGYNITLEMKKVKSRRRH